uniref:DUF3778 domain-containing protein n=1 Tax=Oryza brachyantha TaxID=4533 RepID=J3M5U4_ORYBR
NFSSLLLWIKRLIFCFFCQTRTQCIALGRRCYGLFNLRARLQITVVIRFN